MQTIVIIGNGIAGTSLARAIRKKSKDKLVVISSESPYFFSRPALMYVYMGHMKQDQTKPYEDWFWSKNNIDLVFDHVNAINPANKTISLASDKSIAYDKLILATGSKPKFLDWPGSKLKGVQGLFSLQDLHNMEENTSGIKKAVVAGGGLIGVEMVEMLLSRGIDVTYLIREFKFWNRILPNEEGAIIENHMRAHGVNLKFNSELKAIHGDQQVIGITTQKNEEIPCEFVGVCIGVEPNTELAKTSGIDCNKGILVNDHFETSQTDIYAIGDCAEIRQPSFGRPPIEQIWYTGKMQALTLAETLTGNKTSYQPGNFFNSAKIFDIEYQVYSRTMVATEPLDSIVYCNSKLEKSIRIYYNKATLSFEGIVVLGVRFRHEICDRWLNENRTMDYVMEHLADGNFDPEFSQHFEQELVNVYNKKFEKNIQLKKADKKRIFGLL